MSGGRRSRVPSRLATDRSFASSSRSWGAVAATGEGVIRPLATPNTAAAASG